MIPRHDFILIEPDKAKEESEGGIYLPTEVREKRQEGTVVEVGPGRLLDSGVRVCPDVAPGDRILCSKFGGIEVTVDDKELLLVRDGDVIAVLKRAEARRPKT